MEVTFCELKNKQVVNVLDGKQLGHICDIVINPANAKIVGFIVPGSKSGINIFKANENIFIPYQNICKIGEDVILVEVYNTNYKASKLNTNISLSQINTTEQTDNQQ